MLDRTQAPPIRQVENITLPEIETYELTNGRNLYVHRESNTGAFKIEILTDGGNIAASGASLVQLSIKMLSEGTRNKTSQELSEAIDSLGSFLEINPGFDHSSIGIYGLTKYFKANLNLLSEMLYHSAFGEHSLKILKEKEINRLKMNQEKGSYLSSINLRKSLFPNHPYGYSLDESEINELSIESLIRFHQNHLLSFDVYLAGDLPEDAIKIVQDLFQINKESINAYQWNHKSEPEFIEVRDPKFIQSSIKIGRRLFNRTHQDYFKFIVTNEALGGFFGSRLMKNIREDKGYTYGIYSAIYPLAKDGYFLISTDVKGENEKETVEEIKKEINLLQNEPISDAELETVKNYMIGTFVNSFSTPFAPITKFKTVNTQGIKFEFYQEYISQIKQVTADDILALANQYLSYPSMTVSIVGA